ncbi:hypothetical protein [Arthrobacter sp. ok909]|uniref:hypothetical protein n=1 Tax=Arthrobacter sp. ok909 TaxID=1761746 RepID=UPI0020C87C6D|nr:hypothetical protein [Arthrobacter sp. ok909]
MEYTRLGRSGLKVSRIALGGMSFGDSSRGFTDWALDDDAAEPIFRQAVELGITFWAPQTFMASAPPRKPWAGPSRSTPDARTSSSPPK